jgi:predicted aspartyl protease
MQKCKKEKVRSGMSKIRDHGKRGRTVNLQSADSQCYSVGCISEDKREYIELQVRESKTGRLKFLLDTGADICQCYSVGCISENKREYIELQVRESKTGRLKFLLDTGADMCLVKSTKLLGTTEFDPQQKVKVKSIDGSIVKTHGIVNICVHKGELNIPFDFHLVNKQVELVYDGIVGRDFLRHTRVKVCYVSNTVTFKTESA